MQGFPSTQQWVGFILAVFVASIVINTVSKRIPALASVQMGF